MSTLTSCKFTPEAHKDYLEFKEQNPKIAERIGELIKDIRNTPFSGIGKPEPLKYNLNGCWSRRITQQHRLVYRVSGGVLEIISCKYHY